MYVFVRPTLSRNSGSTASRPSPVSECVRLSTDARSEVEHSSIPPAAAEASCARNLLAG